MKDLREQIEGLPYFDGIPGAIKKADVLALLPEPREPIIPPHGKYGGPLVRVVAYYEDGTEQSFYHGLFTGSQPPAVTGINICGLHNLEYIDGCPRCAEAGRKALAVRPPAVQPQSNVGIAAAALRDAFDAGLAVRTEAPSIRLKCNECRRVWYVSTLQTSPRAPLSERTHCPDCNGSSFCSYPERPAPESAPPAEPRPVDPANPDPAKPREACMSNVLTKPISGLGRITFDIQSAQMAVPMRFDQSAPPRPPAEGGDTPLPVTEPTTAQPSDTREAVEAAASREQPLIGEALKKAYAALRRHHRWHLDKTEPDPEFGFIPADEYGDSTLYDETDDALHALHMMLWPAQESAPLDGAAE